MGATQKYEMQKWMKTIDWSHFITIEPTPSLPFKQDEIIQRMRTMEYQLNKKYLKSSFPKWDADYRNHFIEKRYMGLEDFSKLSETDMEKLKNDGGLILDKFDFDN